MFEFTKLITTLLLPPFIVIILGFFALLSFIFKFPKMAWLSAVLSLGILYIVSIPYTTQKLSDTLVTEDHLSINDYRQAQAIVVLGGGLRDSRELYHSVTVPGIALERMRYAAYLHKETELPILISGASSNGNSEAKIMAQEFFTFFSVQAKWLEERSLNTIQNAKFSREMLERENIKKIILVTNQWHMQRAKMLFEREGFVVLPASVGNGITPKSYGLNLMLFIPQAGAINANMQLLKEWLGYWKEKIW